MRTRRINKLVVSLLKENGIRKAPVPVERVAKSQGFKIESSPFDGDISGMVYRDQEKEQIIIGVNSNESENRKRFTIAHEIGHALLHEGMEVHIDKSYKVNLRSEVASQAVDIEEMEANRFAAELLMPEEFLKRDFNVSEMDPDDAEILIQKLAKKYKVSAIAMSYRLLNLGIIDQT